MSPRRTRCSVLRPAAESGLAPARWTATPDTGQRGPKHSPNRTPNRPSSAQPDARFAGTGLTRQAGWALRSVAQGPHNGAVADGAARRRVSRRLTNTQKILDHICSLHCPAFAADHGRRREPAGARWIHNRHGRHRRACIAANSPHLVGGRALATRSIRRRIDCEKWNGLTQSCGVK